jgi:hypothetical protein
MGCSHFILFPIIKTFSSYFKMKQWTKIHVTKNIRDVSRLSHLEIYILPRSTSCEHDKYKLYNLG